MQLQNDYGVRIVSAPAKEPVTLAQAKTQCAIEQEEIYWNEDLKALVQLAREYVERQCNISLITQTLALHLPRFPQASKRQHLPRGPVQTLGTITYIDPDGGSQTLDGVQLSTGYNPAFIIPAAGEYWPPVAIDHPNPVTIQYTAGYGNNPSNVPELAKRLMLLLIAHWFRNREAVLVGTISKEIEFAASALADQVKPGDEYFQYGPGCED